MIQLIPYFRCTNLHILSLLFILFFIQYKIAGNRDVFKYFYLVILVSTNLYWKNGQVQQTKNQTSVCLVLLFEVDLVHLLSTSVNLSSVSELPQPIGIFQFPRRWERCWLFLISDLTMWIRTGLILLNTCSLLIFHFFVQNIIRHNPVI